ncbi:two-component sensor histidine kinase [Rhodococcus sp. 06-412-2C]|uniref:sensor histidine kinase n=1 Tax=unclassified Rhodococcus (in: high G+C Gram-positive bacteria) TaxID=192944 RepID=UPI000B9AA517|nr:MULTISPECIES: HAMP domain-containing sensor histidine kinase [unclassified Rhodococcus (in: high G+C Gram-positive bacteria)]OZC84281.1 two-component sensor histidine kinase [Rhodococcus sp. 06-412-2C]OZC94465.1 two-component sensor histidine kinase [Rhodococcus sp. 06-412-2B]
MPLRFTLVAALLLLVGLGLLASGVAVTSSLETSLMRRLDQQLIEASEGWAKPGNERPPFSVDEPNPGRPPSNFYVRFVADDGTVRGPINDVTEDVPDLSGTLSVTPETVGSEGDPSKQWRVITVTNSEGSTTVGMSLSANQQTVSRLVVLQFYIGAAVLLALAVIAYFVVRRSLRPLREVETTAAAIAAGDLHRRVPEWSEKTEVGRLSAALNGMLSQIQRAFAATAASEEAARASEDRMRRFVADASHELRTPLTTIRGFAELYRQGAMSDISLLMTRIEGESARMGLLVEDLLMLARLDAQRPLDMRRVDVLTIAADAVHDAKAVSPARDISLKVLAGPGIPEVDGDDARLRQVLANLVGNAVRHTPESASITVCVGTTRSSVLLEVEDTGPGLAEDEAAHVFERFYRADSSRTRESGGSGLGLSIVAALVAAHNGTVSVRSTPGTGASFRVELPRPTG